MLFRVSRCVLVMQKQRTKLKNLNFLVAKATKQYYTILIENKFDVIVTFGVAPFYEENSHGSVSHGSVSCVMCIFLDGHASLQDMVSEHLKK